MNQLSGLRLPSGELPFRLESSTALRAKPLLKWAGGKTRLLPVLRRAVPTTFRRYLEPFLGGAALFFNLGPAEALLSDSNWELISCYEVVRDRAEELIRQLSRCRVSEAEFYRVRALVPDDLLPVDPVHVSRERLWPRLPAFDLVTLLLPATSDGVVPGVHELNEPQITKNLELLADFGTDVLIFWMSGLQLPLECIQLSEGEPVLSQSANEIEDIERPAP